MKHYLTYLQESMQKYWDKDALCNYKGKKYSYADMAKEIAKLHILFEKIGVKKGDKIALCAGNTAEWGITFLAVTSYEAVVVPLLNGFTAEEVKDLTNHSESTLLVTEKDIFDKLEVSEMPIIKGIIDLPDFSVVYDNGSNISEVYATLEDEFNKKYPKGLKPENISYPTNNFDKLALINYTSGTTSSPKGVMLTYANVSSNIQFACEHIPCPAGSTLVSMLPLAHMYGMAFEFLYPIASGYQIYFLGKTPTPKVLLQALKVVKPYLLITVPLVIEKIIKGNVMPVVNKPVMKVLLSIPGISHIITSKIRAKLITALGGNLHELILGGAAINQEVEKWMKRIKLPYTVGYGMTECAPLLAYEEHNSFAQGSCGKCVERMEIRIDSSDPQDVIGEIQVRGENVMLGYYKNPEATDATFTKDGWLRTGDLGIIDAKGNVFIKGRSKNMILTSNGQNIYPEEIEDKLNNLPYVIESLLVERNKILVALIYPDFAKLKENGIDESGLAELMEESRKKVNGKLSSYSQIAKIEIRQEEFEKTPKKSIRRFMYK